MTHSQPTFARSILKAISIISRHIKRRAVVFTECLLRTGRLHFFSEGKRRLRWVTSYHTSGEAGFTLLEMIAVVAIIGVLAAIAVPRYQLYVARSQVASAYLLLKGQQISVEDHLLRGQIPTMAALGYSVQHVKHLHGKWNVTSQGALRYDFGDGAAPRIEKGSWLELRPGNDTRGWLCVAGGNLAKELVPTGCQAEGGAGVKLVDATKG
ncbi:hypothetical protein LMG33818_000563 [Halomonadaceae bacterium LMG 33818]|uniref:pilin n=1 Tax=Cernens ardua TaxID=3402176 RepID=UPI003EDC29B1